MDGNRRWARSRWFPVFMGHQEGYKNVENIIEISAEYDISYLTLWWLSTENLKNRPEDEIEKIIALIDKAKELLPKLQANNIKFNTIWDTSKLPKKTQKILEEMRKTTQENTALTVTIALIYGGRDEIIRGIKKMVSQWIDSHDITESSFREYLDVAWLPIPDVIVRTGWDSRTSGFLLYDSPYSELYFTEKKWPEFDREELEKVIDFFHQSKRNFWK